MAGAAGEREIKTEERSRQAAAGWEGKGPRSRAGFSRCTHAPARGDCVPARTASSCPGCKPSAAVCIPSASKGIFPPWSSLVRQAQPVCISGLCLGDPFALIPHHRTPLLPEGCPGPEDAQPPLEIPARKGHRVLSAWRGRHEPSFACRWTPTALQPSEELNSPSNLLAQRKLTLPLTHITAMKYFGFLVFLWEHYIFPFQKEKKSISL